MENRTIAARGRYPLSPLIGRVLDAARQVEYAELKTASVLNRCSNPSMPFYWTINPYRGCEFGCAYCFARYTHDFLGYEDWLAFERRIFVKRGAPEVLRRDLRRVRVTGREIAIGTATDPYQPAERHYRLTRRILEELAGCAGLTVSITTKSQLVVRDLDLLAELQRRSSITVHFSITTLDARLARVMEPRAPTPQKRFDALASVAAAGIPAELFLMPVVPGLTDQPDNLEQLVEHAQRCGARAVHTGVLRLTASTRRRFLPWLKEREPRLARAYRRGYAGQAQAPEAYRRRIAGFVRAACARHGFGLQQRAEPARGRELQLALPLE